IVSHEERIASQQAEVLDGDFVFYQRALFRIGRLRPEAETIGDEMLVHQRHPEIAGRYRPTHGHHVHGRLSLRHPSPGAAGSAGNARLHVLTNLPLTAKEGRAPGLGGTRLAHDVDASGLEEKDIL